MATAVGSYATTSALKALIGKTDSDDDTIIGLICDRVNGYIESPGGTGRVIAPVSSAAYLLDGDGSDRLYFPRGIRAITLLEIANYTGGTYATELATNYVLRPPAHERSVGWPATWLHLTNASTQHRVFPPGYDTVRMTATTGFAAIPDEITNLALIVAQRAWNARESGYQNVDGVDEQGRPIVARFFELPEYSVLQGYRLPVA